jgi:hypothetical protein
MALINSLNPELKFLNETIFGSWPPKNIIRLLGSIKQVPPTYGMSKMQAVRRRDDSSMSMYVK